MSGDRQWLTTGDPKDGVAEAMTVHVLVLNYNGRALLARCLPSVVEAARRCRWPCAVSVIDNHSQDDSVEWLRKQSFPVGLFSQPNRGLCSFNEVLRDIDEPIAVLLNNDISLASDSLDPLIEPLMTADSRLFFTAPRCWRHDSRHEGFKTAVAWRHGLVQATGLFPGHERVTNAADWTASAGAALAVDRRKFLSLGGFDPLYLPGRIEDLDLCYRAFLAGWHGEYVPASHAWHIGAASFGATFGEAGCDALALRNTLLFQWKNLRSLRNRLRLAWGMAMRIARDAALAPIVESPQRWRTFRAIREAWRRRKMLRNRPFAPLHRPDREREFFSRFSAETLLMPPHVPIVEQHPCDERGNRRDHRLLCAPKFESESEPDSEKLVASAESAI